MPRVPVIPTGDCSPAAARNQAAAEPAARERLRIGLRACANVLFFRQVSAFPPSPVPGSHLVAIARPGASHDT